MKLSKVFDPDLIKTVMKATSKEDAVDQLAELFCKKYPDKSKEEIIRAVSEREKLSNTSIGRGVAFPHARTDIVTGLYVALGIAPDGIYTSTPDNKPLHIVVLLLTPRNISRRYLQTLSGLAKLVRKADTMSSLLKIDSPVEVIDIIDKTDIQVEKVLTVGDIMTAEPVTVTLDKTLKDVVNIFFKYKISGLPVVDSSGKLAGEISETELLKFALPNYKSFIANIANITEVESFEDLLHREYSLTVSKLVKKAPVVVDVDAPVVEAAALMLFKRAERVMVLSNDKLVGVVTKSDIISKIIRG
jgi:mannitol/fructose-specific phosphotransferase system IIA component (Ntr-type)/CBS domain-containing protein